MSSSQLEINFRSLAEQDESPVRELAREAGSEREEIDHFLQHDQVAVAARESTEDFLGFIAYCFNQDRLEISELGVKENYRQQGVGTKLLEKAKETALEKKLDKLSVETSNDNIPALSLYQQFGFRIKGVKLGKLAEHHGQEETGWRGILVRDLFQLELEL